MLQPDLAIGFLLPDREWHKSMHEIPHGSPSTREICKNYVVPNGDFALQSAASDDTRNEALHSLSFILT